MSDEQKPAAWMDDSGHPRHVGHVQTATERRLYGPLRPLFEQAAIDAAVAAERERSRIDQQDLALMIGRLVTALRKARPMAPQDLDFKAIDLLRRKGLAPSPLREQAPAGEKT